MHTQQHILITIPSEKRLKIGNIAKIIFGAQEAPILALFWRF